MKDDAVYLRRILECIRRIGDNTRDGRAEFLQTHTLQDATLRNLQVLSESAQHLSDKLKGQRSAIEWKRIAAFRNILVHDYLGIDLERIWEIIQRDLPPLRRAVTEMLAESHRPK